VTWAVKMNGNTTSGIDINPLFSVAPPHGTQLIVRRIYKVATTENCRPVQTAVNQIIANTVAPPNVVPTASVPVEPGETILITLRITGTTGFSPDAAGVVVTAQAKNTDTRQIQRFAGLQHVGPHAVLRATCPGTSHRRRS
jgi:hypothetical protein